MNKFIATFMVVCSVLLSSGNIALAKELNYNENVLDLVIGETFVEIGEAIVETIDTSQLPEGIVPIEFDSIEEKEQYINDLISKLSEPIEVEKGVVVSPFATHGTATIDSTRAQGMTITLKANFGTSGSNNTGTITYIEPFTTATRFTFTLDWVQRNAGASITSSGKDAYVYVNGEVVEYLFIQGLLEYRRIPVSLSGYAYLAR